MPHETPTTEIFEEIKAAAIKIWKTYDDTYGYASKKVARVESLENFQDNIMVAFRMFDWTNQRKMMRSLSKKSFEYIVKNQ